MGVRVLGVSLTTAQEILYWFLLPALLRATVYIAELALAIGVAQHHFTQGDLRWGFATLAVIYTPSIAFFVATVSQPGAWETNSPRATAAWFCARLAQLLVFPAWAIYRYGKRLFWSIEALTSRGALREQALDRASRGSRIELYLFMHALLHSAPQAALQLGVTLTQCRRGLPVNDTQVLSVFASLFVLASALASFQRFESQRLAGRREPWRVDKPATLEGGKLATLERGKPADLATAPQHATTEKPATLDAEIGELETLDEGRPPATPTDRRPSSSSSSTSSSSSSSSSPTPSPVPTVRRPRSPPPPPPAAHAPLLPPEETAPSPPPLPRRRRTVRGLGPDDPLGRSVSAVGWFLLLVSRYGAVLALASVRAGLVAGLLAAHVAVAAGCLLAAMPHAARRNVDKVFQRLGLAVVFLVCPLEYGVRFARPRLVFGVFLVAVLVEDIACTLVWYFADDADADDTDVDSYWHGFLVAVIFTSQALSLLCLGVYVALLRPKVTAFYVD